MEEEQFSQNFLESTNLKIKFNLKETCRSDLRKCKSFSDLTSLRKSKIFTNEKLLHTIQMSNVYTDSKTFVDMATKYDENEVLTNFIKLGEKPSIENIKQFLDENFYKAGHDIVQVEPKDWSDKAPFLSKITDQRLINFGIFLNAKWKLLLRIFDQTKICQTCTSSALRTKNSFIVPGGRFSELYYWDTYWCIEGLLSSGMIQTAKEIIENFLDIVKINGFVPNGLRVYYLNRSQPPLLTQMVDVYYRKTNDRKFLQDSIEYLDREYNYWMCKKSIKIRFNKKYYKLNLYKVKSDSPRPESYKEDYENALKSDDKSYYFSNIITATESGWDFSSRWFTDPFDIKTIQIVNIIPVDLNAIMFKNEKCLLKFHKILLSKKIKFYERAVRRREVAINTVLWNKDLNTWGDFNFKTNQLHNDYLYISDLSPLWFGVKPPVDRSLILKRYESLLYSHVCGIPASNIKSGQQWDYPNVWAPYHYWIVDYFRLNELKQEALHIANRFVNCVYYGWFRTNYIYEKYDADNLGLYGGGGEYIVQEGFGWTNGVVVKFLDWFNDEIKLLD